MTHNVIMFWSSSESSEIITSAKVTAIPASALTNAFKSQSPLYPSFSKTTQNFCAGLLKYVHEYIWKAKMNKTYVSVLIPKE